MELRHLRYFVAVAEELSFTRAAARLHIAQPPLSTQIKGLEEELGAQLFVRDKRRIYLTQAGSQLLDRARAILADAEEAKAMTRSVAAGVIATLHMGYTTSSMFTDRVPNVLNAFRAANPSVLLHLHEMTSFDQFMALRERKLDVGLLRKPDIPVPEGIVIHPWLQTPLIVAVRSDHRLAAAESLDLAELGTEPLITYPRDSGIGLHWCIVDLCMKAGYRPQVVRNARDPTVMVGLVAAGQGVAIVPQDTQCIRMPGVSYLSIRCERAVSMLHLAHRSGQECEHVVRLLDAFKKVHAESPPSSATTH